MIAPPVLSMELPSEAVERKSASRLQPITPWTLNFADNMCRLSRLFGDAEKPHLLVFEQAAPKGTFGMTLAGPDIRRFRKGSWVYLGLKNNVPMRHLSGAIRGSIDQIGPAIIIGTVIVEESNDDSETTDAITSTGIDLQEAAEIERVVLRVGSTVLSYETQSMAAAFQALNVCTSDLLASWGLDPQKHKAYQAPEWINSEPVVRRIQNYPRAALYRGEQGILRMRVIVESDGTVSDCHIEESTKTTKLVSPACEEMRKAVFKPALDSSGAPMRSYYATSIRYVIG